MRRFLRQNSKGKGVGNAIKNLLVFGLAAPQSKKGIDVADDLAKDVRDDVPGILRNPGAGLGNAGAGVINRKPEVDREVGRAVGDGLDAFNGANVVGEAQAEVVGRAINGLLNLG